MPKRDDAVAAVGAWASREGLGAPWTALCERLDLGAGFFAHPMSLPVIELPGWLCVEAPEGAVDAAGRSAVSGYLYARLMDDLVDGDRGRGEAVPDALLAGALMGHHLDQLATAAGDAACRVLSVASARWARFAAAMVAEHQHRACGEPLDDATALDRSRPLVLPVLAVRAHMGLPTDDLLPLIDVLVGSHQRFNDLVDADRDRAHGHHTPAVAMLQRADALSSGAVDAYVDGILADLDRCAGHAAGLDCWLTARAARVEQTRQRMWASYLRTWLGMETDP